MLACTVNTNPVVIRRLLLDLHDAGLIVTRLGPSGGATLSRDPRRISLADIYRATEDRRLFAAHPNKPSRACPVGCRIEKVLDDILEKTTAAILRELSAITLAAVLRDLRRRP
jgi:DNA-binding IscR family transcriptional regulator